MGHSRTVASSVIIAVLVMMSVVVYSIGILNVLFLSFIAIVSAVYMYQSDIVYYPSLPSDSRTNVRNPSIVQLDYEDVVLTARDGTKVHAFLLSILDRALQIFSQMFALQQGVVRVKAFTVVPVPPFYTFMGMQVILDTGF